MTQNRGDAPLADQHLQRIVKAGELGFADRRSRQPDSVGDGLQLAGFVDVEQPFLVDQVPGDVLIDHCDALFAEPAGFQHAQQPPIVGLQDQCHVADLGQVLAEHERGT